MVEFLFHHETTASLSEMPATDKQQAGPDKASFPLKLAECRNDIA